MAPVRTAVRSWTTSASKPKETIRTTVSSSRPSTTARTRSTRRVDPSTSVRATNSGSAFIPNSRAKRFSLPAGQCRRGTSALAASGATSRTAPSPPTTTTASRPWRGSRSHRWVSKPGLVGRRSISSPRPRPTAATRSAMARARPAPEIGLKITRTDMIGEYDFPANQEPPITDGPGADRRRMTRCS